MKTHKKMGLILATVLAFLIGVNGEGKALKNNWYLCDPNIVCLTGTITARTENGVLGNESDPKHSRKIKILVLKLEHPINVKGDKSGQMNEKDLTGVKELQLIFKASLNKYVNQKATLKGVLFEAIAGNQFTDVLMRVIKISGKDK